MALGMCLLTVDTYYEFKLQDGTFFTYFVVEMCSIICLIVARCCHSLL